jgi:hypothetical protein
VNTKKICLIGFPSTQQMLQVLIDISLKVLLQKRHGAMQELFIKKKERKKELEKNGQVSEILKTMGT